MTQIAYPTLYDAAIDYNENQIPFLVIENRKEYRNLLRDITRQKEGFDGNFLISNDSKAIQFKFIDVIDQYVEDMLNNKTLVSKLISMMEIELMEERYAEDLLKVDSLLQNLLFDVSEELPYEIEFNDSIIIKDIVKQFNPHFFNDDSDDFKDRLLNYMLISRDLLGTKAFILKDLKLFFSQLEVEELYKSFFYEKLNVIVLQSEKVYSNSNELIVTVDDDLCVIY